MAAIRVMTLNLRRDVESDGPQRWSERRDLVAALIEEHTPDLLGTQEGLPHQLAELDDRLPGYCRVGTPRDGGADEACAIFISMTRFRVTSFGTFWLSDVPEVEGSATWGNHHPRIVTWARVKAHGSLEELLVANTHFDHESQEARLRSAALLAARLPGAILMGDLNAAPGDAAHRIITKAGWSDGGAADPTFHGFTGVAHRRLDHIFAPATHRIHRHRVVARARSGVHASDHHAVLVEMDAPR